MVGASDPLLSETGALWIGCISGGVIEVSLTRHDFQRDRCGRFGVFPPREARVEDIRIVMSQSIDPRPQFDWAAAFANADAETP